MTDPFFRGTRRTSWGRRKTEEFLGGFAIVDVADDEAAKTSAGKLAQACGAES